LRIKYGYRISSQSWKQGGSSKIRGRGLLLRKEVVFSLFPSRFPEGKVKKGETLPAIEKIRTKWFGVKADSPGSRNSPEGEKVRLQNPLHLPTLGA
jgi:hypothetical protein